MADRGAAERQLAVSTDPPVTGEWHWTGDDTAHWQPSRYYPSGTSVTVAPGGQPPTTFTPR